MPETLPEILFETKDLRKTYPSGRRIVYALNGVSLRIQKGETLSLVGESGCGKTTFARTLLGIYAPTAGVVYWKGKNTSALTRQEKEQFTRENQMIFQDPYASLDPRMTAGTSIAEGLRHVEHLSRKEQERRVQELLETVGLHGEFAARFPHELSGGQRQRIGIARALAMRPSFLVLDEPIAALDVSIQAQVINLLMHLQQEKGLTYLMISHDLTMVRHISRHVAVMYLGQIMESGTTKDIYEEPLHPYTKALMAAVPKAEPDSAWLQKGEFLEGDVPSPLQPPSGCPFAPRCPLADAACAKAAPPLQERKPGHAAACWKAG